MSCRRVSLPTPHPVIVHRPLLPTSRSHRVQTAQFKRVRLYAPFSFPTQRMPPQQSRKVGASDQLWFATNWGHTEMPPSPKRRRSLLPSLFAHAHLHRPGNGYGPLRFWWPSKSLILNLDFLRTLVGNTTNARLSRREDEGSVADELKRITPQRKITWY